MREKMNKYSLDRHVPSDTRFSRGMWEVKHGVAIEWATSGFTAEVQNKGKSLFSSASTRPHRERADSLNCPSISSKIGSPGEGILSFEAFHHISSYRNAKEPRFELTKSESHKVTATTNDDVSKFSAEGGVQAKLNHQPYQFEFLDNDEKLLTKLGYRSLGFVRDERYPRSDVTAIKDSRYFTAQLHLSVGEKLYGLGERFGPLVKNGQRVELWNEDGGTSSEWTYKNIPFYISSRGYGVFIDNSSDVVLELQSERTTRVNITVPGEGIRFHIIHGPDFKTILKRYAQLTGFPALPPAWTFGLWLSTSFTTNYDLETVSSFIQGMKDRDIPLSTFHFDCFWMRGFHWCDFEFDPQTFPDAKKMLQTLKTKFGVKICVWINPYIAQNSKIFPEGDDNGYFIKSIDGSSYQTDLWQSGMAIVDFTNPDACKWFQSKLEALVDIGVDCFKTDFGERIPCNDVTFFDGANPVAMHNYYTLIYNKVVFEMLEKKLGKNEACLFARSATTGGQQFPVHWGGDCESSFEAMAESLRGGLSLALSGFGFWSHDIGGFEGDPDPAIYKRWVAFGLLSSHSRLHGSGSFRVPWNFDDEASVVLKNFTKLKISLMPYIFQHAIEAHKTATPLMRALLLEYPKDRNTLEVDSQFFLGDSLLVAPVFSAEGDVNYYVPEGSWYGLLDGKIRESTGSWFDEKHDFKSLPLLVRPNSVIVTSSPKADNITPEYAWNDNFTINLYDISEHGKVAKIPDPKKPGEFAAKVVVTKKGTSLKVDVSGKFKTPYYIKIWGSKDKSISVPNVPVEKDFLSNYVLEVKSSSTEISFD